MSRSTSTIKVSAFARDGMHMGDNWRQDDQLLDKLFPVGPTPNPNYQKARKMLFNDNIRYKRWKRILANPKPMSRLYTPLTFLLNSILECYGIDKEERFFMDTHLRTKQKYISPGILLSGVGIEFATTNAGRPRDVWASCIAVLEVALDSDELTAVRNRLVVHMDSIFENQDNRRFAFGLVITQNMFTVYLFDHSGAVASGSCNYHQHPDQFCAVISGLAGEGGRIGFDLSVYSTGPLTKIRTLQPRENEPESETEVEYEVTDDLFHFSSLIGRGTICWLAKLVEDPESEFVIKDAWIAPSDPPGKESEATLLRHAQSCGVVMGVVQIHHFEEVRRSADKSDLDTVLRNRLVDVVTSKSLEMERVHIRIVMSPCGKEFQFFNSKEELIFAFRDAVVAHRNLHEIAGILHRDISARNILINESGIEGNRGILIDLDHSIRVGDSSPYSKKTLMGTRRYMSKNVLEERHRHSYLDDLESFYYVLLWILVAYEGPYTPIEQLPHTLQAWDGPFPVPGKYMHFYYEFELSISPWFGEALRNLVLKLHKYFSLRLSFNKDPPTLNPKKDYDEFLGHIDQAMADLAKETEERKTPPREGDASSTTHVPARSIHSPSPNQYHESRTASINVEAPVPSHLEQHATTPMSSMSAIRRRRRRRRAELKQQRHLEASPPRARPRRKTANYGGQQRTKHT